jgi:hypothetical protein
VVVLSVARVYEKMFVKGKRATRSPYKTQSFSAWRDGLREMLGVCSPWTIVIHRNPAINYKEVNVAINDVVQGRWTEESAFRFKTLNTRQHDITPLENNRTKRSMLRAKVIMISTDSRS